MLQIISQNYVVWNRFSVIQKLKSKKLQIISQNYVVWNAHYFNILVGLVLVANYITKLRGLKLISPLDFNFLALKVANYITKLRGLKQQALKLTLQQALSCKLYHKTTWFETKPSLMFAGLSLALQIISQNYVVWNLIA